MDALTSIRPRHNPARGIVTAAVMSAAFLAFTLAGSAGALAQAGAVVSVDTRNAETMRAALDAGARIVNDVSMGRDPALLAAVAAHDAELVLMHTRVAPKHKLGML